MRSLLYILTFAIPLTAILAVALVCPILKDRLLVNVARLGCLAAGATGAGLCLRQYLTANGP